MTISIPATRYFIMTRALNESQDSAQNAPDAGTKSTELATESKNSFSQKQKEPLQCQKAKNKPGITYSAQDHLPKLPIPELESTLKKYCDALLPLQTSREQEDTKAAAKEFLENEGKGLQERLKKYATGKTSYIEQFWYDSYLNSDNPVVLNLNPFFLLEDDPTPARNNQVTRAASLVISALCFVRAVRKEELPPDSLKGTPLDMFQYSRLFGTARVPTEHGCIIGQDSSAKHMVVMCKGQFYWFDVLDANDDLIMTEKDVALNLQVIVGDAEQIPIQEAAKAAVGVLSTENRKVWSGLRDVLTRGEGSTNAECLNVVDSALFVLCLDYTEPTNVSDLCGNMLCGTNEVVKGVQVGTCTNRWYDKLQIIVCKNGSAGINFEHTGVDGHTVLRFASDVYTDTILRFARTINGQAPTLWTSTSPDPRKRDPESFGDVSTTPRKLEWDMIPELSTALRFAETRLADLIHQNEFQTLDFAGYGRNFMTLMGFSPDAFVQMAFQAAYYGLYGRSENTYEPAMTKVFLHGRTEAIRSVTPESVDFVKTFWADNTPQKKVDALKRATQKHTAITKECSKAQGQDRHLYALYCVWQRAVDEEDAETEDSPEPSSSNGQTSPSVSNQDSNSPRRSHESTPDHHPTSSSPRPNQTPTLFLDPGWEKLNHTILSTSNCGNPSLRHFGFGPVSANGFGIGYIIKDDSVSFCASSKHRQTRRFVDSLEGYLVEIRKLLRAAHQRVGSGKETRAREVDGGGAAAAGGMRRGLGRLVRGDGVVGSGTGTGTGQDGGQEVEGDDGLGGCKSVIFFSLFSFFCSFSPLRTSFRDTQPLPTLYN